MSDTQIQPPPAPHTSPEHRLGHPKRGLAITALVLGIAAILAAAVPVLGAVIGIIGIVFGIIAMKKRQSRGLSLTGLILSGIATVISIVVTIVIITTAGALISVFEENGEFSAEWSVEAEDGFIIEDDGSELRGTQPLNPSVPIGWADLQASNSPASTNAGTPEDPHEIGTRFPIAGFDVVVNFVDMDATESLLALEPDNQPPAADERYVLIHLTFHNASAETLPVYNVALYYDTPKQMYPAVVSHRYHLTTPSPAIFLEDPHISGDYSGYAAIRTKDVDGELLRLNSSDRSEEIWVKTQ